jgi:hypothetical protein
MTGKTHMARQAAHQEASEGEPDDAPMTHPEEIGFEAALTISGKPTALASIRTTRAGVMRAVKW